MQTGKLITRSTLVTTAADVAGDFIILEVGDARYAPARNTVFSPQLSIIKDIKVPIGIHYTIDAQWYAENVSKLDDDTKWPALQDDTHIKDLSWAIGTMRAAWRPPDFIILACRQRNGMPSPQWLYKAQERIANMAWEEWEIPWWCEFDRDYIDNKVWDKGLNGETMMARQVDVSMKQLTTSTVTDFEMFTLLDRGGCFWRYADGVDNTKLYKFYGDLVDYLGLDFGVVPPVVPPEETVDPVWKALVDAQLLDLAATATDLKNKMNLFAEYIAWLKECPR